VGGAKIILTHVGKPTVEEQQIPRSLKRGVPSKIHPDVPPGESVKAWVQRWSVKSCELQGITAALPAAWAKRYCPLEIFMAGLNFPSV
jgi:hypothetical protein